MSADEKMPPTRIAVNEEYAKSEALKYHYQELYSRWKHNLQPCEISESEVDKVIENRLNLLSICQETYIESKPIEVTDIVEDNNGVITFKSPTKVESNEAVEFAEWLNLNCATDGDNTWRYYSNAGNLYTTTQLYEIFKNRK